MGKQVRLKNVSKKWAKSFNKPKTLKKSKKKGMRVRQGGKFLCEDEINTLFKKLRVLFGHVDGYTEDGATLFASAEKTFPLPLETAQNLVGALYTKGDDPLALHNFLQNYTGESVRKKRCSFHDLTRNKRALNKRLTFYFRSPSTTMKRLLGSSNSRSIRVWSQLFLGPLPRL